MKIKNLISFLSFLVICLLTSSCKSIYLSDIHSTHSIGDKLPPLEVTYDLNSFYSTYGVRKTVDITDSSTQSESTKKDDENSLTKKDEHSRMHQANSKFSPSVLKEQKVKLIQDLFEYDVNNNICSKLGNTKGSIECKLISAKTGDSGDFYKIISYIGGLCAINLFGFPNHTCTASMEIQVTISDSKDNRIVVYSSGYQTYTAYVTCWWGYSSIDGLSRAKYGVFNRCMDSIKNQISRDRDIILKGLQTE